ncbi:minor tail subunit [Mycobacterium phage Julie1]|uniref:Minor tail subunit n=1 Tax=Mycobacterium phage Julie1 TaxID=1463812 RepID=W8EB49_9CAUD|nr:minor tail protein [Mycobacterium phage Julie1]AHJ88527.1 minor tail subunit [Mycobacterium phage Julie1]
MAGWFDAPPAPITVGAPGWTDDEPTPGVDPVVEVGWWAVLTIDARQTAGRSQAMTLRAIKVWALTNLAASSESMTLRKIAMVALTETAEAVESATLQKIAMLALSRTAPGYQALGLVKVMEMALATSQAGSSDVLALTRIGTLALTATGDATQGLMIERVVTVTLARSATATEALTMARIYLLDLFAYGIIGGAYYSGYALGAMSLNSISSMAPFSSGAGSGETLTFGFRPTAAATTILTASGNYTIPRWADWIDVVTLGAGEAGTGIVFGNGSGGRAGEWNAQRYYRGTQLAWSQTVMQATVGAGGTGNGGPGGQTYVFPGSGLATLLSNGGDGNMGAVNPGGESAGSYTFNGVTYVGGGGQGSLGNAGIAPGGGGAGGGFGASSGGAGARGQVWFRAGQG